MSAASLGFGPMEISTPCAYQFVKKWYLTLQRAGVRSRDRGARTRIILDPTKGFKHLGWVSKATGFPWRRHPCGHMDGGRALHTSGSPALHTSGSSAIVSQHGFYFGHGVRPKSHTDAVQRFLRYRRKVERLHKGYTPAQVSLYKMRIWSPSSSYI